MPAITFSVFPPPALAKDVECVRVAESRQGQSLEVKTCPNCLPGIVFQIGENSPAIESIATRSYRVSGLPTLFLHGQGAEPSVMNFKPGPFTTIQVVLKPYALYTLFGLDSAALTRGLLQSDEFGAQELQNQLVAANDNATRVTLLEKFLLKNFEKSRPRDLLVERCVELVRKNIDSVTVKNLLEWLGVSERQLQKRFAHVVGCSPQQYIRVKRINEALRLMSSGRYKKLSDIAFALNFYDQSHFIRDMKELTWVTPKNITQNVTDFRQDRAGASYI